MPPLATIREIIKKTSDYLGDKGVPSPRLDAELLLAHVLQVKRLTLYLEYDRPLSKDELDQMRELVRRRGKREPLQHLTGRQGFWKIELAVTPDVLIPRPETEILVEEAEKAAGNFSAPRILDLGSGSGAIALALAADLPQARIFALDISRPALELARRNSAELKLDGRVQWLQMDLTTGLRNARPAWEVIVSNPPYIAESDFPELMPEVRDFEPRLALDGGPEGLAVLRRIISAAPALLVPGGNLILEIDHQQAAAVTELLEQTQAFNPISLVRDYQGHKRVINALRQEV